ncbi:MAG TPA: acetone carboxylase [Nocardioidaceae bacterium]|nr:acetone carboxylase [Nocardioidaceae bacterium]
MTDNDASSNAELVCSAKDCRAPATVALRWNNPKLHTPDRRKVWFACPDHEEHLARFLDLRGFLRDRVPAGDA